VATAAAAVALTAGMAAGSVSTAAAVNYRQIYGKAFFGPTAAQDCQAAGVDGVNRGMFDFFRCRQEPDYVHLDGFIITS
jgi:hypothetical protein